MHKKSFISIHFAGGNKFSFNEFNKYLKNDFDIYHLELAGRGSRIGEDLLTDLSSIRDDLFKQIENKLNNPYILYGHSMGGLLAYLLTLLIEEKKLLLPSQLIISGRSNPQMKPKDIRHDLPREQFKNILKELNGTPIQVLENEELFEFFEPILRADFQAIERFHFDENRKVSANLMVLFGDEEKNFTLDDAKKWEQFTTKAFSLHQFSGNHFFIFKEIEKICELIKNESC